MIQGDLGQSRVILVIWFDIGSFGVVWGDTCSSRDGSGRSGVILVDTL